MTQKEALEAYQDICNQLFEMANEADASRHYLEAMGKKFKLLRQFIEGQGWKPIETAPMDGTKVLITNGRWVYTAKWKSDCQHGGFEERVGWQIFDCEDPYYSVAAENHEITHWKPISPPSGEE